MKHRKLRIAWSVAWGIAVVALVALWVRSYWTASEYNSLNGFDSTPKQFPSFVVDLQSYRGLVSCTIMGMPSWWCSLMRSMPHIRLGVCEIRSNGVSTLAVKSHDSLLVVFLAAIAAAPWLPWSPRHFSLRTLLIATTLVAVMLGLIVWLAGAR